MTQRSITYLKGRFETNDIPSQSDYQDVFDSFLAFGTTAEQTLSGPLVVPATVEASHVSAASVTIEDGSVDVSRVSAATVSANAVYISQKIVFPYADVSAAGTTQSSAARTSACVTYVHVNDDDRGIVLDTHENGRVQYIINDTGSTTAASVFPSEGCNFIGTAENGPLLLAAGQTIQTIHVNSSAYSWNRY